MKRFACFLSGLVLALDSSPDAQQRWTRTGTLAPPEGYVGTGRHFGWAASLSGDWALVAAPPLEGGSQAGVVYLYEWWGPTWRLDRTLEIPGGLPGDDFGRTVALGDGTALIGAPGEDAAYVFVHEGGEWNQALHLARGAGTEFGAEVALHGDAGFVGAPGSDEVIVLERVASVWGVVETLTSGPEGRGLDFGRALAFDGQHLAVGAPDGESAHVFGRRANGPNAPSTWVREVILQAPSGSDHFGASLALSGATLVVGAPDDDQEGHAYVYSLEGAAWRFDEALVPTVLSSEHDYGATVSIQGQVIAVGAPGDYGDEGALYAFEHGADGWSQSARFEADPQPGPARFAYHVATDGGHLLGNIGLNDAGVLSLYVGALYLYSHRPRLDDAGWAPAADPASGTRSLDLDAGAVHAGRPFVLLGSSQGTEPALPWNGLELPLAADPLLSFTLRQPGGPLSGNLDAEGKAHIELELPPALAGRRLHFAAVLLCPRTGIGEVVSLALSVEPGVR